VLFGVLCDVVMLVAAYVGYYLYRHAVNKVLLTDKNVNYSSSIILTMKAADFFLTSATNYH
jgi:hypothetical protein